VYHLSYLGNIEHRKLLNSSCEYAVLGERIDLSCQIPSQERVYRNSRLILSSINRCLFVSCGTNSFLLYEQVVVSEQTEADDGFGVCTDFSAGEFGVMADDLDFMTCTRAHINSGGTDILIRCNMDARLSTE
jgi:hypothetical protein